MDELQELLPALLGHAFLGLALAVLVWTVGLGVLSSARTTAIAKDEALFAYPIGVLVVVAACWISLDHGSLGDVVAVVAVAATVVPLVRRGLLVPLGPVLRALGLALGPTVAVAVLLGLYYHGPSASLDSHAYGDINIYVARLAAMKADPFGLPDLVTYPYSFSPLQIGATVLAAPFPVDPFLVHATTWSAFLGASLAIGIGLATAGRTGPISPDATAALLLAAAVGYPTLVAESPPTALALPLAFPAFAFLRAARLGRASAVYLAAVGLAAALTKVVVGIPIVLSGAVATRRLPTRIRFLAAAAALVAVVAAVALTVWRAGSWPFQLLGLELQPADAVRGARSLRGTTSGHDVAPAFYDLGIAAICFALVRARAWVLLAVLVPVVLADWLVSGVVLLPAVGLALVVVGLWVADRPLESRWALLAGSLLVSIGAWFRDPAQLPVSFSLWLLLVAAVLFAFRGARGIDYTWALAVGAAAAAGCALALSGHAYVGFLACCAIAATLRIRPQALPWAAASLVLIASVVGFRAERESRFGLGDYVTVLSTDDYALWREVERRVPAHALIFTTLTGPDADSMTEGWNYYPGVAGRQLYIAGWNNSPLRQNRAELSLRLARNDAVLGGRLDPRRIAGDRPYFGVRRRNERPTPGESRVYVNDRYVLFSLSG